MEEYQSGHTGLVSKTMRKVIYTRVRIPLPPPFKHHLLDFKNKLTKLSSADSKGAGATGAEPGSRKNLAKFYASYQTYLFLTLNPLFCQILWFTNPFY